MPYDNNCEIVDRYQNANPSILVVFAAGNSGSDGAGSVGSPALAKNSVT